jgi:predicted nucleic acid-binding protein
MLIDTNVFLSALLKQNDWKTSEDFFMFMERQNIRCFMSDFSLHSICLILSRRKENNTLITFLENLIKKTYLTIIKVNSQDLLAITKLKQKLDFDDRIQYFFAKQKNIPLITYDNDFKDCGISCLTPAQAIKSLALF